MKILPWNYSKFVIILLCLFSMASPVLGQYSLDKLLANARANHPLTEIIDLNANENKLAVKNSNMIYYPSLQISGQATYQSDVTSIDIPFPGIEIPTPEKDQYKLIAEVGQLIYDGGLTKRKKELLRSKAVMEQTTFQMDWNKVKHSIISVYFGILELNAQNTILDYTYANIENALTTLQVAIDNGVSTATQGLEMKAGLLKIQQKQSELKALKGQLAEQLSILTFTEIPIDADLEIPGSVETNIIPGNGLPFTLIANQQQMLISQYKLENTGLQPKLAAFIQVGYGSPGLNFLDSDFTDFYIGGLRLQWNIQKLYTLHKDKQIFHLRQMQLDQHKTALILQQKLNNSASDYSLQALEEQMELDKEMVELRNEISASAEVRLEQGVINSTEFLQIINEERSAREMLEIHKIQLLKTQYLKVNDNE